VTRTHIYTHTMCAHEHVEPQGDPVLCFNKQLYRTKPKSNKQN